MVPAEVVRFKWEPVEWLVLVADRTGTDALPGVFLQGGPPESTLKDILGPLDTWVEGKPVPVSPLETIRPRA